MLLVQSTGFTCWSDEFCKQLESCKTRARPGLHGSKLPNWEPAAQNLMFLGTYSLNPAFPAVQSLKNAEKEIIQFDFSIICSWKTLTMKSRPTAFHYNSLPCEALTHTLLGWEIAWFGSIWQNNIYCLQTRTVKLMHSVVYMFFAKSYFWRLCFWSIISCMLSPFILASVKTNSNAAAEC